MKSDFGNAKTIATSEGVSVKLKQTQAEAIQRKVSEEFEGSDMRFKAREVRIGYEIPKEVAYAWFREQLLTDADEVATMTGLPELAAWKHLKVPGESLRVGKLVDAYRAQNPAKRQQSKNAVITAFQRLVDFCNAKTLDDLTTAKLLAFRQTIETDKALASGETRAALFARIRALIRFGQKVGLDAMQISMALDRCKVLWTATRKSAPKPTPISKDDFHTLLKADTGAWRAWLLLGLNLCMHLDEVCDLKWGDFDLTKKTYAAIRGKEDASRIPRAAVLWPETLAALEMIGKRGKSPYVFTSRTGTRFNRNTRGNEFRELADSVGLSLVTYDWIRDGAYTAACRSRIDDKWARLLAGHATPGLQDKYVLRNPEIVAPACEAVYAAYGPFAV